MTEKRIYLDHAAATPVLPEVTELMATYGEKQYGNPGAIHGEGESAKRAVSDARRSVADALGAQPDEVYFAPSATIALNVAIVGCVRAWMREHPGVIPRVIVSSIEHAAVLEPCTSLKKEGVDVVQLPVNAGGIIDLIALEALITEHTVLVAVMYANNEIGTVQPIRAVSKILREKRAEYGAKTKEEIAYPLFLSDACQALNYLDLSVQGLGTDMLVLNAAKSRGPKGVGILFMRRGVPVDPIFFGGGQEMGFFPGTENVPAIVGGTRAIEIARTEYKEKGKMIEGVRDYLLGLLQKEFPDAYLNGDLESRLPNNISISFEGVDHENLVIMLDQEGIACSTKSACNETDAEVSHVIEALRRAGGGIGFPPSALRISLGEENTKKEMDQFVQTLKGLRERMRPLVH